MQLERVPPRAAYPQDYGTPNPWFGVSPSGHPSRLEDVFTSLPRRRAGWKAWLLLAIVCLAMLGAGERFEMDYRFESPSAALLTYWEALSVNDSELLFECFSQPSATMPQPGMVWFLPPMQKLGLYSLLWETIDDGHVLVSYEVRYWAQEGMVEESFDTATELVRINGQWHIVPPEEGETEWPQWTPIPRVFKV